MAQYDLTIIYIPREDNTIADTLSRLPNSVNDLPLPPAAAMLSVQTDPILLQSILDGYKSDLFCSKLANAKKSIDGIHCKTGLLYIGERLVIPHVGSLHEDLFRLAHDSLGHFGFEKSYAALCDAYYWPNMQHDLLEAYIPACTDCQRNKGHTSKPPGPLHPLPIPDASRDSIALDFIGPCPMDDGFDCIVTITDRLGSDIGIAPTRITITAKRFDA